MLLAFLYLSGPGDIIVDEGTLKINAASNNVIKVDGPGNLQVNKAASLFLSRNSGTFELGSQTPITAGATLELPHGEPDTIAQLWIGRVQQPAGIYGADRSSFITGMDPIILVKILVGTVGWGSSFAAYGSGRSVALRLPVAARWARLLRNRNSSHPRATSECSAPCRSPS